MIYILAPNNTAASSYARGRGLTPKEFVYADSVKRFAGLEYQAGDEVVIVLAEQFYRRGDAVELVSAATACGFSVKRARDDAWR